jgi:hypothetical protein
MSGIDGPRLANQRLTYQGSSPPAVEETPATLVNNGTTYEKAWVVSAANSFDGIRKE